MASEKVVIGISFGTVYSCVSIPGKNGLSPEAIANEDGDRQIPSYVAFTGHEELCGTQAKSQALSNPKGTITHFRQMLGHNITDPTIKQHQATFKQGPKIVASKVDENLPAFEIELFEEDSEVATIHQHSVVEVTAKYLKKLKDTAEYYLSGKVDGCVISIPAHFEEKQKLALVQAAKNAGFAFAYPIHEPVAAALAFNASILQENANPDKQILVLDLGAESFNISLISSHDGLYTIEDSIEELALGGVSFDKVLFDLAKEDFKRKTKMDISENKRSVTKLMNACERTKRSLTRQDTAPCSVESLFEGMDYNGTVLRQRFEMVSDGLYSRCKQAVLDGLKKNHVKVEDVDQVLLVGGSSRMPKFQQIMKSLFPNVGGSTEFRTEVEPDEAITLGCAAQAAFLGQDLNSEFEKKVIEAEHLSKTVGVLGADKAFHSIIPHGTPIPVRRAFSVPLTPGQTSIHLEIAELEENEATTIVAEVGLSNIPSNVKAGVVEVVFLIENDHVLNVTITEKVSGESVSARLH